MINVNKNKLIKSIRYDPSDSHVFTYRMNHQWEFHMRIISTTVVWRYSDKLNGTDGKSTFMECDTVEEAKKYFKINKDYFLLSFNPNEGFNDPY